MKFNGPLSELHACGPAGEGGIGDAWQYAQQKERERGRERLTLQGQEDSAGRKRQIQQGSHLQDF